MPLFRSLLVFLSAAALHAQAPFIFYRGVVNVASYMPPGLPSGAIARGAQFSIFGRSLGPAASPPLSFPLSTTLAGVSISVTQGSTVVAAIPVFLSPGQINAIMPSNAPLGLVSLRVTFNNFRSNLVPVRVATSSFGIFTSTGTGQGPGSIQNYFPTALPLNGLSTAASVGQTVILYGVGLGAALGPDNVAPGSTNLPTQTEVFVAGIPAPVSYSGRASCCAGIDQINFQVPAGAPSGCWVPVSVRTEGAIVSNHVTMAIGPSASCSEPANPLVSALLTGGQQASFFASRFSTRHDVNVASPLEAVGDFASATLYQQNAGPYNFDPSISLPPAGTCTTYSVSGYVPADLVRMSGVGPTGKPLNAGALAIIGPTGSSPLYPGRSPGFFTNIVGGAIPLLSQLPNLLFLNPGSFSMTAAGGPDIPAFSVPFSFPPSFTWTNRDSLSSVNRSQPLTVNWSGVASGYSVLVTGGGIDIPANATTSFVCLARPGDTSLTVPPTVLANIPAAHARLSQSLGAIYVGEMPLTNPVVFSAPGLTAAQLMPSQVLGKSVSFQ